MKMNNFKQIFITKILDEISKLGYKYIKSREVFECINGEHLFFVHVYMYKRSTFIEIETKAYYGNNNMTKKLKQKGITLPIKKISGGDIEFLCSYYFKKDFPEKYDNLIFMLNDDPKCIIKDWLGYFYSIILPFFEDCKNPMLLNNMVNNIPIEKVGLNATYQTRVYYSYFVGQKAGIKNEELLELINHYEEELKSWGNDCDYINEFLYLKKQLC